MKNQSAYVTLLYCILLLNSCGAPVNPVDTNDSMGNNGNGYTGDEYQIDPEDANYATIEIFYATDRDATGNGMPAYFYGIEHDALSYGKCKVSIPRDHRMGELEEPSIWKLEFSEDPEEHVVLLNVEPTAREKFFYSLSDFVFYSPEKSAFLFIHGYNTSFEDAARRTAQMTYDLGFKGAPTFYSWPSQASLDEYGKDEEMIAQSCSNFKNFLKEFLKHSGAEQIYLIAHSMGNRAMTDALVDLQRELPGMKDIVEEIILAAPDIDAAVFKEDIMPRMLNASNSITLYASSNDKALQASELVHEGHPRAGDSEHGLVIVEGLMTIDASSVKTGLLGHSYYAETSSILSDMFYIIREGKDPDERFGLEAIETSMGRYWRFRN